MLYTPKKQKSEKKYWYNDHLSLLKENVEIEGCPHVLTSIGDDSVYPFKMQNGYSFDFLYPYEEPPKKRMTNRQLMEWIGKRNGMFKYEKIGTLCYTAKSCREEELNDEIDESIVICSCDSEEWIEPTVDIYERDCKGE